MAEEKPTPAQRHVLLRLLGIVGLLICLAGVAGVWFVKFRIDSVIQLIDQRAATSLERLDERLVQVEGLIDDSKLTVEDLRQDLTHWTGEEATERISARLDLNEKIDRVATGLQRGTSMIETSRETLESVAAMLELAFSNNAAVVDPLLERIEVFLTDLNETTAAIETLKQDLASHKQAEADDNRIKEFAKVAAQILATLGDLDTRMEVVRDRVAQVSQRVEDVSNKVRARTLAAAALASALLAWMALGQAALCRKV